MQFGGDTHDREVQAPGRQKGIDRVEYEALIVDRAKAVPARVHGTGELGLLGGLEQPGVMASHHPKADHRAAEPGCWSPWLHVRQG